MAEGRARRCQKSENQQKTGKQLLSDTQGSGGTRPPAAGNEPYIRTIGNGTEA